MLYEGNYLYIICLLCKDYFDGPIVNRTYTLFSSIGQLDDIRRISHYMLDMKLRDSSLLHPLFCVLRINKFHSCEMVEYFIILHLPFSLTSPICLYIRDALLNLMWQAIKEAPIPELKNPILLEGLPGIGNVGKIAIDFVIEELKAKKIYSLFSYTFPHSVFVNDDDLVELPSIEMYYKKLGKRDLLILTGDVQPVDEVSSYEFCEKVIELAKGLHSKEIITTGGIGLATVPEKAKVYITGNNKEIIKKYAKGTNVETKIHGVVGPIIGVSGLLVGLGKMRGMDAVALLAETYGHPMYLGVGGAVEILRVLNTKLGIKLNLNKLNREIEHLEKETIKRTNKISAITEAMKKGKNEASYIG